MGIRDDSLIHFPVASTVSGETAQLESGLYHSQTVSPQAHFLISSLALQTLTREEKQEEHRTHIGAVEAYLSVTTVMKFT